MTVVRCPTCRNPVRVPADAPVGSSIRCPQCTTTFDPGGEGGPPRRKPSAARRRGGLPVGMWILIAIPLLACPCVGGVGLIGYLASREETKAGGLALSRDDSPVADPDSAWGRARGRWVSRGPDGSEFVLEFTGEKGQRHVRSTVLRPGFRESRGFMVMAIELRGNGRFTLKAPATNNPDHDARNDLGVFWFDGGQLFRQSTDGSGPIRYERGS